MDKNIENLKYEDFFCFTEERKSRMFGMMSKWWQNLHFWVSYPFKINNTNFFPLASSPGLVSKDIQSWGTEWNVKSKLIHHGVRVCLWDVPLEYQ